ncbi:phage tail tape measure protein [Parasutterella sp.]|uniref:phage tail tape measure protein n=1 Tax=Parasutterella sp. TaxID=2049037 RepID=UPI00204C7EEF|nr:MAG TPA: minor tail protein [Caudoviricetes sp.]DAT52869.1 MAG TPA: minor tail protein [Caudoviricetes sp.]DAY47917.1 MAG TPA: minor tail protein [Caudoviricetes sp.]
MSAKSYEIMFEVAAAVNSKFPSAFKKAAETVQKAEDRVRGLNKQYEKVGSLIKQTEKTKQLSAQYFRQKEALNNLRAAIQRTNSTSSVMLSEEKKLAKAVNDSHRALNTQTKSLSNLRKELNLTGRSLDDVKKKHKLLAEQSAVASRVNNIAKARSGVEFMESSLAEKGMGSMVALSTLGSSVMHYAETPVKQAMQMEDAMAEIKKVVDFTSPDGLQKMQAALEKMSLSIPITAEGLAKITAAAGQAGIAEKDLIRFTETAAKMGVAFDISAEEAGEMMAKWRSGMNLTQDQVESLADATNALSNNNAAMAKQVGEALKRYGALGKVAGLTEKQTAAMAATIIGAGAEAEVAATGMNAFMRALTKGGSMTDLQKAAFGNLGFDALQLQKDVQKNAPKTIFAVLEAVKTKLPKELQMQYLTAMFGEEGARAMGPMLANTEKLRENFDLVAESEKYAGSMEKEFLSRSATTSNALELASNAMSYFARAVGDPMLGTLKERALDFVKLGEAAGTWIKENQTLVKWFLYISGVVLSCVAVFHMLRVAFFVLGAPVLKLITTGMKLYEGLLLIRGGLSTNTAAIKAYSFAMSVWKGGILVATKALGGLKVAATAAGSAMKFMFTNPIGMAITAIATLVLAGIYLYKNWDEVKAKLVELWTAFEEKFPGLAATMKNIYEGSIKPTIDGIKTTFQGLISFISGVFSGDWTKAWEGAKTSFSGCFQALPEFAKGPLNLVISLANKAIAGLNSLGSFTVPDWVPGVGGKSMGINIPQIPMLASGGIATGPSLAMVGEGREPEAILPLSRLGGMMGAGGPSISVNFSPVIQITGAGAVREDVQSGLRAGVADLKRELERLLNSERRLSYA